MGPGVEKKADNAFEKTDVHLGAQEKVTLQMSKSDKGLRGRKMGFTLVPEQNEFQQDRLRRGIRKNFLRMRKEFDLGRNDEENVNGFPGAFQIGHMSIKSYDLGVTVPGCVCVRV